MMKAMRFNDVLRSNKLTVTVKEMLAGAIAGSIEEAVRAGLLPEAEYPEVKIEYPREARFGDYSTPVALESAKAVKKAPVEIAGIIKPYIEKIGIVESVEVVKPGFINIFISNAFMCETLKTVIKEATDYGRSKSANTQKYNIEFVSANPTGPMNVVSARAAAIGDTLANLLEAAGHSVDREFYVNDFGNQVTLLGRSVLARVMEQRGEKVDFPEDGYHGDYVKDIAANLIELVWDQFEQISGEEQRIRFCADYAVKYNVAGQKKDLTDFHVEFSRWFMEHTLHDSGAVMDTYTLLDGRGHIFDEEGKKLFKSTDYGDDKDRVVVRDDGRPTYLLADIAYHRDKLGRGYDTIIDIWGPDHHGYIARLSGAMAAMGCREDGFKVLIAQQVNLVMDGEAVKMSKRLGRFSTMRELIEEIGVDAARYFFVMRSMDSHLDFDLSLAKKQSSENPVFYLQYAHARICSIFREAEKRGVEYDTGNISNTVLDNPEAAALMKLLVKYPEEIIDAAAAMEPHRLPAFLMKLAQAFHRFYTEHRILADEEDVRNSNFAAAAAVRTVLKNGLTMLGVSAPESM